MVVAGLFPQVVGTGKLVSAYDLTAGYPAVQPEDVVESGLVRGELGGHAACPGASSGGGVDQDGLTDAGELAEKPRTDRSSPCWRARRRIRWASWRARTQVKTWTRMLCSVQWCIGENDTTCGVFHLPEPEFGLGLGPVPGDDVGNGPVVVAGDQHVLAEDLLFQRGAGDRVDVPGQPQVLGLVAGQFPVMTRRTQGLAVIASISAWTLSGQAGLPRARVRPARRASFRPWRAWCRRTRGPGCRAVPGSA